jgi:hypothetical protein
MEVVPSSAFLYYSRIQIRFSDPEPFDTDPDPTFHFDPGQNPTFHFATDPDPTV